MLIKCLSGLLVNINQNNFTITKNMQYVDIQIIITLHLYVSHLYKRSRNTVASKGHRFFNSQSERGRSVQCGALRPLMHHPSYPNFISPARHMQCQLGLLLQSQVPSHSSPFLSSKPYCTESLYQIFVLSYSFSGFLNRPLSCKLNF